MIPFDDMLPEEVEPQHQAIQLLLRRAYRTSAPLPPAEQEQIIARVRTHLLQSDARIKAEATPVQSPESIDVTLPGQPSPAFKTRRRVRVVHLLNSLAAVLIVGAIIGASLLLFHHLSPSNEAPPGSTNTTVRAEAKGVAMSLQITSGPYFLSEMLAADISLTNHTSTTFFVGMPFAPSRCASFYGVDITGGSAPFYTVPADGVSCPPGYFATPLKPGQTFTVHRYVPLTNSGHVTLTTKTTFFKATTYAGYQDFTPTASPFDGAWPSLQVNVSPKVPAGRMLSLKASSNHVTVITPAAAHSHLVYFYSVMCQPPSEWGGTGNAGWQAIATNEVDAPSTCSGNYPSGRWTFAFGAPGYAIVSGNLDIS